MRVAQIVLPGAPLYERKSQRVDQAALAPQHEVLSATLETLDPATADVAHIYGPPELPRAPFVRFPLPYLASGRPPGSRFGWRRATEPARVVTPLNDRDDTLPEAVDDRYFAGPALRTAPATRTIGVLRGDRPDVAAVIEQTRMRIDRFRDDVRWQVFDAPPSPEEIAALDAWIDPATEATDFDGYVAEALAASRVVVASRTPINAQRLEQGRGGFLVPPGDPNELAHAILTALFKPEAAEQKIGASRQTVSKFRARQRLRVLSQMYADLIA